MSDPRIEKLADVLVNYSVAVQPGDQVYINANTVCDPLIKAVYKKVLQAGGNPFTYLVLPEMDELFFQHATDQQLSHYPDPLKLVGENYQVGISIQGHTNTKALSRVDPHKKMLSRRARRDTLTTTLRRMATKEYRWVGTQFPTNADAQEAGMSLHEYEDFVYGACLPDFEDPVGYWQRLSAWQQKVVEWLRGKESVRILGNEIDLQMSIKDRIFINCDGHENMPDGEIYTEPVKNSVEGEVTFSYPAFYDGHEVSGVRLWFEKGRVVKATANTGQDFLLKMLETDEGARYLGEFAIGTNQAITRFSRNTLFDEKLSSSFHLALGAGFTETGGGNESAIHWDMVSDLSKVGEIWVDNQLLYRNGMFLLDF